MQIDTGSRVEHLQGAEAVLAGVSMSKTDRNALVTAWRPLSGNGRDAQMKVLYAFVGERDLEWPWFNDCLARFEKLGRYPEVSGWDIFQPCESDPEPTTADEALNWIDIGEARSLLKEASVTPVGRKNADIFNALYEHVPFERWHPLALVAWKRSEEARLDGPDADEVAHAKIQLLAVSMSAADYVAHRVEQLRAMVRDGSMSGIRIEPDDAITQAIMHDPSPYCPQPGLPPFFPGDNSGVSGIRAEQIAATAPSTQASVQQLAAGTARGISSEKTRESIAVFLVIGAVILAWIVGAMTDSVVVGVIVMLLLFIPIWKSYSN